MNACVVLWNHGNYCMVTIVWNTQSTAYDITSNLEVGQRVYTVLPKIFYWRHMKVPLFPLRVRCVQLIARAWCYAYIDDTKTLVRPTHVAFMHVTSLQKFLFGKINNIVLGERCIPIKIRAHPINGSPQPCTPSLLTLCIRCFRWTIRY